MTAGRRPSVRGAHARRPRTVRRASAGLSSVRAAAILAMLLSAGATYGAAASSAFGLARIDVPTLAYTDPAAVRAALATASGTNLFALSTGPLVERLDALPTIAAASVEVRLPDRIVVHVTERKPLLIWRVGTTDYLVDRGGTLFAAVGSTPRPEVAALPVVSDSRATSQTMSVGSRLDPVDLDAATRLGSLKPADLGSVAQALTIAVTDANGFVVGTTPASWTAIFGFYTPTLRTADLIPGQVRLLRSLLAGREGSVDRVILADATNGTYTAKPTPKPSPTARP